MARSPPGLAVVTGASTGIGYAGGFNPTVAIADARFWWRTRYSRC
jgi:hypothetical protein